jgi:ubiquinone/menaquinone biosynthesis C-methylase UbiE
MGAETKNALEMQAQEPGIGTAAQARLRALAGALRDQIQEIANIIGPVLGSPLPPDREAGLPRGAVEYNAYLYRDWAWSDGHHEENQRSLAAIRRVAEGRELGRTLVLGAGACRLAYDLHLSSGASDTTVVDIDPYLLVVAEAVIRGASVHLTEAAANVQESDLVSRRWTLSAPGGPLGDDEFHFYLANGVEPPFEAESFDTIVTPWFIDQVPPDLETFLGTVHRLLAPGGRWINHGPLIYPSGALPMSRWYAREEIDALARAIGFTMGEWQSESIPYLVSPLMGRGKIEKVFTFQAGRA